MNIVANANVNHPRSLAGQWNLTKQFIWLGKGGALAPLKS